MGLHVWSHVVQQQAYPQGVTCVEDMSGVLNTEAVHSQDHKTQTAKALTSLLSCIEGMTQRPYGVVQPLSVPDFQ